MAAPPERRPHRVLASLIEKLEATKPKAGLVDPATDFAVCRQFALSVYARADRNDVNASGTSNAPPTRTQVEAFSAAGTFLAALDQSSFAGMCDDDIRARRDYAEWRAWDLATAMHAGRQPSPVNGHGGGSSPKETVGIDAFTPPPPAAPPAPPGARAASRVPNRVPNRVPRRLAPPAHGCAAFDPRAASLRRAVATAPAAPARSPVALRGFPVAADVGGAAVGAALGQLGSAAPRGRRGAVQREGGRIQAREGLESGHQRRSAGVRGGGGRRGAQHGGGEAGALALAASARRRRRRGIGIDGGRERERRRRVRGRVRRVRAAVAFGVSRGCRGGAERRARPEQERHGARARVGDGGGAVSGPEPRGPRGRFGVFETSDGRPGATALRTKTAGWYPSFSYYSVYY